METASNTNLPSKTVNQGVCSRADRARELYPTPRPLTQAIISTGELPHALLEPACGLGDMANVLIEHGHKVTCSDIEDYGWRGQDFQADFFDIQRTDAEAIVSNPPFSMSGRFVRHGLRLCPKVVILNRLAFLEGKCRNDIVDRHLSRVYPFIERPPMMHRWSRGLYEKCPSPECTKACKRCNGAGVIFIRDDGVWREWQGRKSSSAMPVAIFVFERDHDTSRGTNLRRVSINAR